MGWRAEPIIKLPNGSPHIFQKKIISERPNIKNNNNAIQFPIDYDSSAMDGDDNRRNIKTQQKKQKQNERMDFFYPKGFFQAK